MLGLTLQHASSLVAQVKTCFGTAWWEAFLQLLSQTHPLRLGGEGGEDMGEEEQEEHVEGEEANEREMGRKHGWSRKRSTNLGLRRFCGETPRRHAITTLRF